jgi:hypothetical protein
LSTEVIQKTSTAGVLLTVAAALCLIGALFTPFIAGAAAVGVGIVAVLRARRESWSGLYRAAVVISAAAVVVALLIIFFALDLGADVIKIGPVLPSPAG